MSELSFKGKEFVYNHHLAVPHRPLIPDASKSVGNVHLDGNLIIHGDNLHALKSLLPMYAGKVDCIFIDPPYNTGNEGWCYNDNVNSPVTQAWLKENPIGVEDGLRHDKWCAMMWPRLRSLSELLSEHGIIVATIDDNELDHMLCLMDEVFGAANRLACAVWLSDPSGGKQKSALRIGHEYLVIYGGGSPELTKESRVEVELSLADSTGPYAKGRELNKWGANSNRSDRPSMFFPLRAPNGDEVLPIRNDGMDGCWRFGTGSGMIKGVLADPDHAHWELRPYDSGVIVEGKSERWVPYEKIRDQNKAFGWSTWLGSLATNADGTKVIKEIFGSKKFDTPKPLPLLDWVIELCSDPAAIILDSFAGSGTTAHAVLAANKRDGGERKFILVECEDYAETITAERVRRVIQGYAFAGKQREQLLQKSLTYTDLKRADRLLSQVAGIENLETHRFDKIEKKVKDGILTVEGVTNITDRVEGIGGTFTYCTLGDPIDLDRLLTGEDLPSFDQLGALLFHMATSEAINPALVAVKDGHGYLGESAQFHVWLIYKPDLDFLKSRDAALTLAKAKALAQEKPEKRHLVFAPAKFVSQKLLDEAQVRVEFAPLPWALYRTERS
jgi:adenine-specific DNA-methyltransferase